MRSDIHRNLLSLGNFYDHATSPLCNEWCPGEVSAAYAAASSPPITAAGRAHAPFTRAWYPAACQGEWFGGRPCALPAARDADAVAAAELRQEELAESPVPLTPSAASSHRRPTGLAAVWPGPARPHTLGENALRVLSAWPVGVTPLN